MQLSREVSMEQVRDRDASVACVAVSMISQERRTLESIERSQEESGRR